MLKPNKELTVKAAIALTPEYVSLLRYIQRVDRRVAMTFHLADIRSKVSSYVNLYDDERRIGTSLFLALMGEEAFVELINEMKSASEAEQQAFLDEAASFNESELEVLFDGFHLPTTDQELAAARAAFDALPEAEKEIVIKQGAFFWSFFFSSFFNILSLMVHGVKLTTLVPQAIAGDSEAFLKAVQIDRMLLLYHPYFRDRKRDAQNHGELNFLRRLANREINSPLQSKIRYPGLYMLFGVLEAYQWLDDMKHEEILDIVEAAGLDRFQNRIDDVNYLTKRLLEYRRWQKTGVLSML